MGLWSHQQETSDFAQQNNCVYDTSDPGTGKTVAHIDAFDRMQSAGLTNKMLVVCPKSLMQTAWQNDIRSFYPHITSICAYAGDRDKAFEHNVDVYIINTDGVKAIADKPNGWWKKTFGANPTLVIDEMTTFKHRGSARSKAAAKIAKRFTYRRALTGTPYAGSVTELWHQIKILDDGQRLGRSFHGFQSQVCVPEQVGPSTQHIKWVDIKGINDVTSYMIKDINIRHEFETVMDIPEHTSNHKVFDLSRKARTAYDELANHMLLIAEEGKIVSAVHAASLRTKLLQLASGAVYIEDGQYSVICDSRYELITTLIEERKHSVTFFMWKHQRELLTHHATKRGISYEVLDGSTPNKRRAEIVTEYQAGNLQTLFLHPQTGAHGLTLTRGTSTIWASPTYQPDVLKQGQHRVYRGGQTMKTESVLVEARDTVEQLVYERLYDKQSRMLDMMEILRDMSKQRQEAA